MDSVYFYRRGGASMFQESETLTYRVIKSTPEYTNAYSSE